MLHLFQEFNQFPNIIILWLKVNIAFFAFDANVNLPGWFHRRSDYRSKLLLLLVFQDVMFGTFRTFSCSTTTTKSENLYSIYMKVISPLYPFTNTVLKTPSKPLILATTQYMPAGKSCREQNSGISHTRNTWPVVLNRVADWTRCTPEK